MRFILLLFLISCSQEIHHGLIIKKEDVAMIHEGIARKEDVRTILGSPSFQWNNDWYYISTKVMQKAFFVPKVAEHNAYVISFDDQTVTQVKHYTEKDIKRTRIHTTHIAKKKPDLKALLSQ